MSWTLRTGDCRTLLAELPAGSVQCVVTSPPYWGLRDYGVDGQVGLESTVDGYVAMLVDVFRSVRRLLADDGTVWLNLGDCHYNSDKGGYHKPRTIRRDTLQASHLASDFAGAPNRQPQAAPGLKPKDLVGIPWRVAFALQADGWWLRSDIIWSKPNPMRESVRDRPTRAHEYVFLLTQRPRYAYDADAIRTPYVASTLQQMARPYTGQATKDYAAAGAQDPSAVKARIVDKQRGHSRRHAGFNDRWNAMSRRQQRANGANRLTVWTIPTQPFPGAHFAVMPADVAELCILAGSKQGDTVLDPFAGAGTTGVVSLQHDRRFVGIELNPEYVAMAEARIRDAQARREQARIHYETGGPLFADAEPGERQMAPEALLP